MRGQFSPRDMARRKRRRPLDAATPCCRKSWDMIRARLRIGIVLSFFPFMTPTCCMHPPKDRSAEAPRAVQVAHTTAMPVEGERIPADTEKEAHVVRISDFVNQ